MKQRSRFFSINIVLALVLIIILMFDMVLVNVGIYQGDGSSISSEEEDDLLTYDEYIDAIYTKLTIVDASIELLGEVYQDKVADIGYQYYSVKAMVQNTGTESQIVDYMHLYCETDEEYAVFTEYKEFSDSPLAFSNLNIIPPCQTVEVELLVQVKQGVDKVTLCLAEEFEEEPYQMIDFYF